MTLPGAVVELLRTAVADGHAASVSAWIADAVTEKLAAQELLPADDPSRA